MPTDLFSGIWTFNRRRSSLSTRPPQRWLRHLAVTATGIRIHEHIWRPDGSQTTVSIDAQFDGNDHPVTGSPIIDTISYTRTAPNRIVAAGKYNGIVTLTEVSSAGPDGYGLMLIYVVYRGSQPVATGTAVFQKSHPVF